MIGFPNEVPGSFHLSGIATLVTALHQQYPSDVFYYEANNEPDLAGETPTQFVSDLQGFRAAVLAADPTAKILGPEVSNISGGLGLTWLSNFFAAGGGQCIDGVSFHAYNTLNGDLNLGRESLNGLEGLLAQYNLQSLPVWQTEQGAPAAEYGAYNPQLQGQWDLLQTLVLEQYGIPKEHNVLWYDTSHGFWDVPDFWENGDGSPNPVVTLMNVFSQQVYGTAYSSAYHFGTTGDTQYVGNFYGGPSNSVAVFASAGNPNGQIQLSVSGGLSLNVVNAMGVAGTIPVVNGVATLPVGEVPEYVDLAVGQTIGVIPQSWGTDLATQPGVTVASSGSGTPIDGLSNAIAKVNDGVLQTAYYDNNLDNEPWFDNTPQGQPAWLELDLPQPQTVGRTVIYSAEPWNENGSLLDYQLQYQDTTGIWQTIDHVQVSPGVVGFYTPTTATTQDTYYDGQYVFPATFTPVVTNKIRILVVDETFGGAVDQTIARAISGHSGPHNFDVGEFQLFAPDPSTPVSPSLSNSGPVVAGSTAQVVFNNVAGSVASYGYDVGNTGNFVASALPVYTVPADLLSVGNSTVVVEGKVNLSDGTAQFFSTSIAVKPAVLGVTIGGAPDTFTPGVAIPFTANATDPNPDPTLAWTVDRVTAGGIAAVVRDRHRRHLFVHPVQCERLCGERHRDRRRHPSHQHRPGRARPLRRRRRHHRRQLDREVRGRRVRAAWKHQQFAGLRPADVDQRRDLRLFRAGERYPRHAERQRVRADGRVGLQLVRQDAHRQLEVHGRVGPPRHRLSRRLRLPRPVGTGERCRQCDQRRGRDPDDSKFHRRRLPQLRAGRQRVAESHVAGDRQRDPGRLVLRPDRRRRAGANPDRRAFDRDLRVVRRRDAGELGRQIRHPGGGHRGRVRCAAGFGRRLYYFRHVHLGPIHHRRPGPTTIHRHHTDRRRVLQSRRQLRVHTELGRRVSAPGRTLFVGLGLP